LQSLYTPIPGFPGYAIGTEGRIINTNSKKPLKESPNGSGTVMVSLQCGEKKKRTSVKRSLKLLINQTFFYCDLPGELWKDVRGFENLYAVSNKGRVKNLKTGRLLSTKARTINGDGYPLVCLSTPDGRQHSKPVHRLVGEAFLGPLPEGLVTNHIDGSRDNNDVENLEYCTYSENTLHWLQNYSEYARAGFSAA
jgi:hypothetical protein